MHELAIAKKLIETATALLPPNCTQVATVNIELGALAGVSEDELRFGFEVMAAQTACAGAKLEIEAVPAIVHCPQCGKSFPVADSDDLLCPTCGTPAVVVLQGKELLITSIEAHQVEAQQEVVNA